MLTVTHCLVPLKLFFIQLHFQKLEGTSISSNKFSRLKMDDRPNSMYIKLRQIIHCQPKKKVTTWIFLTWGCCSSTSLGSATRGISSAFYLKILNDQVIPSIDFDFLNGPSVFQDSDNAKIHWTSL